MFKQITVGILLITGILILISEFRISDKECDFYSNQFKCSLIFEQRIACYQGCHFFSTQLEGWKDCISNCADLYYVDFDKDDKINFCSYYEDD